ncbi:hypothetical protein L6164_028438 [Bauhinia variegata]|uniref:Uncharacterized protein n=1 Tax=Bauhinia variegata TaxID=167791 RepID=A0ACB9L6H7_BAUVA|nr:hypothetical protein L6164_028438 [Bauhinia variegata]
MPPQDFCPESHTQCVKAREGPSLILLLLASLPTTSSAFPSSLALIRSPSPNLAFSFQLFSQLFCLLFSLGSLWLLSPIFWWYLLSIWSCCSVSSAAV